MFHCRYETNYIFRQIQPQSVPRVARAAKQSLCRILKRSSSTNDRLPLIDVTYIYKKIIEVSLIKILEYRNFFINTRGNLLAEIVLSNIVKCSCTFEPNYDVLIE